MNTLPRTLLLLTLAHALVDAFASIVQPLWPDLQGRLRLDDGAIQWAYVLWGLATSVSQLGFGYWGDRGRGRWLLAAGPALGVLCLSGIGLAGSFPTLVALLLVGGLGIAAFHPEAAAMAGASTPEDRSRAMSIFAVGGYLGQASGPIYGGLVSTHFGIRALRWSLIWGLPILALLVAGLGRRAPRAKTHPSAPAISVSTMVRGRGVAVLLILGIGTLRVLPAAGVPVALAFLMKARGQTNTEIGVVQSVFLAAIGAGSLGCAVFVRRAVERRVLWLLPLMVAPAVWACPMAGRGALMACVGAGGLLLGATLPILVGYGQRLLPEGQRVASSITMGVTWGIGNVIVAGSMAAVNHVGRPDLAFPGFAAACVGSSLLCAWLPDPEARPALATGVIAE